MSDRTQFIELVFYRTSEGVEPVRVWLKALPSQRIARVLIAFHDGVLVALHGFIKKTQKTPDEALSLARKRLKEIRKS